jgi:uncharacterized iron-regulated membrane protein
MRSLALRGSRAGDRFLRWIFPLHTGTAFGLPGRIVIALAGVGLMALIVTGFYVWWTKWRMRRRAALRTRLADRMALSGVGVTAPEEMRL